MESDKLPYDQNEEDDGEHESLHDVLSDLAMGKEVKIVVSSIPTDSDRDIIEALRDAGAEVIIPSDN